MDRASNNTPTDAWTGAWLMVALIFSLLVLPLLEGLYTGRFLLIAGFTATLIMGALATRSTLRLPALVLLSVALPTAWTTLFVDSTPLFVAHCLLGGTFFLFVGGVILFMVVRTPTVTFNSVNNAVSAYLLFGLAWAFSYWAIYVLMPQSLSFPDQPSVSGGGNPHANMEFSPFIYYSFVTMSTVGYGDITPTDPITRTLSWIQSVTGQFYVAVMIAWLVGALPRPGKGAL